MTDRSLSMNKSPWRRFSLRSLLFLILTAALTNSGCISSGRGETGFWSSVSAWAPGWARKYLPQDKRNELVEFRAADGSYFPLFIRRFFPATALFEKQYPRLYLAREGVQMVEVKKLTAKDDALNEANLSWSSDGVYLGFEIIGNENRRILLKDLVGDFARELMVLPAGGEGSFFDGLGQSGMMSWNAGLRWSRDSNRFAFVSNGGVGEFNIYVGSVAGGERTVASSRAKNGYASWNPAGNEIAFVSSRRGSAKIYVVSIDDSEVVQVSHSPDPDLFPEWFPDGKRVVFSTGDSRNHDVASVQKGDDGKWGRPVAITRSDADELRPSVSPDGRFIAFYGESREMDDEEALVETSRWNIHVVPADGRNFPISDHELSRHLVARDVVVDLNTGPAWTPDGRKVVYVKRDPALFNPIHAYDLFEGKTYHFKTNTRMNRDIMMSRLGVLSFRAQVGSWDKVHVALTNQGLQLQARAAKSVKPVFLQNQG
jgi:Tol biopolymer transport system component